MINKALRIMIADPEHVERLLLERDFNRQGYYAVAPVSSLEDVLNLLEYGGRSFDLVLINRSLTGSERFNRLDFCLDYPLIGRAFIYDLPQRRSETLRVPIKGGFDISCVQLPDGAFIRPLRHAADYLSRLATP